MTKRVMFLGASPFQVAAIEYASEAGYHVITVDNRMENPGHALANESHNVSTTDMDGVLALAERLKIDGIVAYASDPAAPTAAFVAEKMGLVGNPYESVRILTHKDLYRKFLKDNGFNTPKTYEDSIRLPAIIKPVDSSGSKGITIVNHAQDIVGAIEYARSFSRSGKYVAEEIVTRKGYQVAGDGFVHDGRLIFRCFANEHFNEGGIVPIGESWPSVLPHDTQQKIHDEIQRLIDLLGIRTGALNFDIMIDADDKIYLMEVGPRNGGNLIPEVTQYATGENMIAATVETAIGRIPRLRMTPPLGYWASYMIHSRIKGVFKQLRISDELDVVEMNMIVKKGNTVYPFTGSQHTLGTMILRFDCESDMLKVMNNTHNYVEVICEK